MNRLWILQKKIKNRSKKLTYLFYVMLGSKVLFRIGYIMLMFNNTYIIRINLNKLLNLLALYRGVFEIRSDIYLKFFFIYYYYFKDKQQYKSLIKS